MTCTFYRLDRAKKTILYIVVKPSDFFRIYTVQQLNKAIIFIRFELYTTMMINKVGIIT